MTGICNAVQLRDDLLLVDFIRIKRAAIPIERGVTLFRFFAADIAKKFIIAGKAAAILRGASALPTQELRVWYSGLGGLQFFDNDPMLPIVAHVIDVTNFSHTLCQKRR